MGGGSGRPLRTPHRRPHLPLGANASSFRGLTASDQQRLRQTAAQSRGSISAFGSYAQGYHERVLRIDELTSALSGSATEDPPAPVRVVA